MPAPATSSRHLYTGHRRGHIQAAPRLRAHRGGPLSRDHPQIPVSMPSLFGFDASAVVHTCSSSHRTPAPLTARRHPQRSPPRLLTGAACGGLESPPARRPRRTYLHHWHSTDRADDLLHRHHFPSGHTWVPIIRSWALTRGYALHPGTRDRYEIRYTRTQHRPHRGRSTTTAEFPAATGLELIIQRTVDALEARPSRLLDIDGVGPVLAARLIGRCGRASRFQTRGRVRLLRRHRSRGGIQRRTDDSSPQPESSSPPAGVGRCPHRPRQAPASEEHFLAAPAPLKHRAIRRSDTSGAGHHS